MDMNTQETDSRRNKKSGLWVAILFIIIGLLFLARNTGLLDSEIFDLIVSWPSLLIFWGIFTIFRRHLVGGAIMIGVGLYFMFPQLNWVTNDWLRIYWPLGFILLGLAIMLGIRSNHGMKDRKHSRRHCTRSMEEERYDTEEGFVTIDSSFNGVKHIVLDPVFKGADIDISFGGAVLDLRKTTLVEPKTVIRVDCTFSGLTIYVPKGCIVRLNLDSNLSGCQDLRSETEIIDTEHTLIIRGDLTFSGLEIRD